MFKWIKKHSYWALAIAVLIVAVVAIGAYAWYFRDMKIVSDTGKWADFATYLSGTVGVAAVVATLVAFVITLRHQQKLIDSQDKMLKEQREQISLTKEEIEEEKKRREIEMAYDNVKNILPVMITSLEVSARNFVESTEFVKIMIRDDLIEDDVDTFERRDLFKYPNRFMQPVMYGGSDVAVEMEVYVNSIMLPCLRIYDFLFSQLEVAPELFKIVDCYLDEKFAGPYHNAQFYMNCVMAYKTGLYDLCFCIKASKYMSVQTDFSDSEEHLKQWCRFGELIKVAKGN